MEGTDWLLLIVGIVLIAAIAAALAAASRQRKGKQVERADSIREGAGERSTAVKQQENKAAEVDAHARVARAEADAKAAEAERLAEAAGREQAHASKERSSVEEEFRTADEVDPRSDTTREAEPTGTDTRDRTTERDTQHDTQHTDDRFRDDNHPR